MSLDDPGKCPLLREDLCAADDCAWWNDAEHECAVATLAKLATMMLFDRNMKTSLDGGRE